MRLEIGREVEFYLEGRWICGSVQSYTCHPSNSDVMLYVIECYGEQYLRDENTVRSIES